MCAYGACYFAGYTLGRKHTENAYNRQIEANTIKQQQALQQEYKKRDEIAEQAQKNIDAVRSDYTDSLNALDRLHVQLQAAKRDAASGSVAASERNAKTVVLYSDLLEKSARRSSELAAYADELSLRLHECNIEK